MVVQQLVLLYMLSRIEPARLSFRESCVAVLRFRTWFLIGVAVGVITAAPALGMLGFYMSRMTEPYLFYGFIVGLVIGLPIGVVVFLRHMREINTLRSALQDEQHENDCRYCI
jgi:uncharacterized membrane protein (Fun14 family)